MAEFPYYVIKAFSDGPFGGNGAGVMPLMDWLDDRLMQKIARENRLSETAFFVPAGEGCYHLRWFTPAVEVDLCGHATLASGFVVLTFLCPDLERVEFTTRAGKLAVARGEGGLLTMDFPSYPPKAVAITPAHQALFGKRPVEILESGMNLMLVFEGSDREILDLEPNFTAMAGFPEHGFIATARGEDCDFVSRYFAPNHGVPEDPVTGSAHCTSGPYWAAKLGKRRMHARQISTPGGDLFLEVKGARIEISGSCFPYLKGAISLP